MYDRMRSVLCGTLILFAVLIGTVCHASALEAQIPDTCNEETLQQIWDYFVDLTENPAGAAAIMGNLYYESHWNPACLETGMEPPSGLTADTYTAAVDLGSHPDFARDGIGYGLAQWTDPGRKAGLLEMAREEEKSVGDLDLQLRYIGGELEKFNMLYRLSTSQSVSFLSDYILENYENPGFQDQEVQMERSAMAEALYARFMAPESVGESKAASLTAAQQKVAWIAMDSEAYGILPRGGYCQAWVTAVYRAAGFPVPSSSSAATAAVEYGISEDLSAIPVGAAVYGKANTRYGHVGIYVGNNLVYHNIGGVAVDSLENWIQVYQGFCWGWPGAYDLTAPA